MRMRGGMHADARYDRGGDGAWGIGGGTEVRRPRAPRAQGEKRAGGLQWNPPFFYGWVVLGVVFITEFAGAGLGGITIPLFFGPMSEDTGWSLTQLTGAVTAQAIAGLVVSPFLGPMIDRVGARKVMLFGAVVAGVGMLALMWAQAIWQFWVLYAITGALGMGELGRLTGTVSVAKWFVRQRGRAMAIATGGLTMGGAVMAPVIAWMVGGIGWRETWGIMGAVMLALVLPVVWLFMRSTPAEMGQAPDGDAMAGGGGGRRAAREEAEWTLRAALQTRTLWILVLGMNLMGLLAGAMLYHQVQFFTTKGLSHQAAAWVFTASLWGATFSRIPWGFLVERVSVRWCLSAIILLRSLGALSLVVVPFPYCIGTFLAFWSFIGGSFGLLQPMVFADYYGSRFLGSIQGSLRVLMSLPQLVGPLFVAWVFDATGTYSKVFAVIAGLGIFAGLLVLLAKPPVQREKPAGGTSPDVIGVRI
ncbi:MAG: MFS transporter [Dehalococcoidia bacterium]|nr:MFS transporter [Dehalococcoidia bacterium]